MAEQKYSGEASNPLNKWFSKIYIINLADNTKRFNKVTKQFVRHGVKYQRFDAVDGRCPKDVKGACDKKRKELEAEYGVKISKKLPPAAASLVIGTREILKDAIKKKYKRILICEDDIVFSRKMEENFKAGIKELEAVEPKWDLLYLGAGGYSGNKGISSEKTAYNKYKTSLSIVSDEYDWYVHYKDDLRSLCDEWCEPLSEHLTRPYKVGGSWCYAFSLKGAKKIYKQLSKVSDHVDQIIPKMSMKGELRTVTFDPPIVFHEKGAFRPDSTIPWEW